MIPLCWICGGPNERAIGLENWSEAEACIECERSFAAWCEHVAKADYDFGETSAESDGQSRGEP